MPTPFDDRRHAGRVLADRLALALPDDDVIVLALPRGGVPVAFEVASRLDAPLEVFVVRKLGLPGHEELAMGAIASGGALHLNRVVIDASGVDDARAARRGWRDGIARRDPVGPRRRRRLRACR